VLLTNTELPRSRARILGGDVPYFNASFGDKNGKWFAFSVFGEEAWQKGINAIDFNSRVAEGESTKLSDISKSEEKKQLLLDNLDKHFATNTREHWVKALRSADVVCAPVNTVLDTSKDADVIANKYVIEVDHPSAGKLKEVGFPWKFSRFTPKAGIAPELGEHNQVILRGLGYSDSDIAQLKKEQVI
jgi:formyl-CoA transferase